MACVVTARISLDDSVVAAERIAEFFAIALNLMAEIDAFAAVELVIILPAPAHLVLGTGALRLSGLILNLMRTLLRTSRLRINQLESANSCSIYSTRVVLM